MSEIYKLMMTCEICDYLFRSENEKAACPKCGRWANFPKMNEIDGEVLLEAVKNISELDDDSLRESLSRIWWFNDTKENIQACWFYLNRILETVTLDYIEEKKIDFAVSAFENYFDDAPTEEQMEAIIDYIIEEEAKIL